MSPSWGYISTRVISATQLWLVQEMGWRRHVYGVRHCYKYWSYLCNSHLLQHGTLCIIQVQEWVCEMAALNPEVLQIWGGNHSGNLNHWILCSQNRSRSRSNQLCAKSRYWVKDFQKRRFWSSLLKYSCARSINSTSIDSTFFKWRPFWNIQYGWQQLISSGHWNYYILRPPKYII